VSSPERQHPRFAADVAIAVHVRGQTIEGRTRNVSRGGLCADLTAALPIGADVELDLVLLFEDDTQSEALRLPARIVWCTALESANQVGVAFRPLDRQLADYLNLFLKYLGSEKATKEPRPTDVDKRFG
jgi:Tfp pilus assembly protein PilZ